MTRFFALVAVLAVSSVASAVALDGRYELRTADIPTFDPVEFAPGPNVDVYDVIVSNSNDGDATSLELALIGDFQNFGTRTFNPDGELQMLGPNTVADSFFVVANELAVEPVDQDGVLSASYTISGGGVLVPAGGEALVAVVTVPTGVSIEAALSGGRAAIGGAFEAVQFIPEPSTAILAGLALVGFAARRNG